MNTYAIVNVTIVPGCLFVSFDTFVSVHMLYKLGTEIDFLPYQFIIRAPGCFLLLSRIASPLTLTLAFDSAIQWPTSHSDAGRHQIR